ncbi:MAG: hypothetical protein HYU66_22220 [Armatimonadetes bacterium]|nr:hypothetical protein [Armatimonadota bacterium]
MMQRDAEGEEPDAEPAAREVTPEEIEEWLAVEPGGGVWWKHLNSAWIWTLVVALLLVGPWWHAGPIPAPTAVTYGVIIAMVYWFMSIPRTEVVRADARGFELSTTNGRVALGWDNVLEVRRIGFRCIVRSAQGEFSFLVDAPTARRVASVLRRAMEAREQGLTLPRMTDVSDAALSPVAPHAASADRGLGTASGQEDAE